MCYKSVNTLGGNHMELTQLSDSELDTKLITLVGAERSVTLQAIEHLNELERRGLFRELGYASLFDYCTRRLCYSESSAYRRISGARCMTEFPQLRQLFLRGEVTLCTIATAANSLREKQTSVADIIGKSKREVERIVANGNPLQILREVIKPVVISTPPLLAAALPTPEERYSLKFTLSRNSFEQFEEVKNRLSNTLGNDLSVEAVVTKLMEHYLKRQKPTARKLRAHNMNGRYLPLAARRKVWERDRGQCTFCAPDGTRCSAKRHLHFDHIEPYALGGRTELSNLRLLCSAHNQLQAERAFSQISTGGSKYKFSRV